MARRSSAGFFRDAQRDAAASLRLQSSWKPSMMREERGLAPVAEEQATSADIDEHEVIAASDLLAHLRRNGPAKPSRGSEAAPRDDKNDSVQGQGLATARKWELHEAALQQWRRDTEVHKRDYQAVQEKYVAYLLEKKVEREGRAQRMSG